MSRREITQDDLKKTLRYDEKTGVFIWIYSPRPGWAGKIAGFAQKSRGKKYWVIKIGNTAHKAHRLAYLYVYGKMPKMIDHKDGNSLNNCIDNLMECDYYQNTQNHTKVLNKSGLPAGVRKLPSGNYQARVRSYNEKIALGSYETPEEAAIVYENKKEKVHHCPARSKC